MRSTLFALLVFGCAAGGLAAADPEPATVSGTGTAEIRRPPEFLRVKFDAQVRGQNLADAIDKLKARREQIAAELAKLGAGKDAVAFGDADVADEAADRADQVGRMMAARARALGKGPKPKTESPTVLYVPVKVDFPLPANNPEGVLVTAKTLEAKIKAADLGGLKTDGKATPEEEEQAEEAIGPGNRMGMDEPARGEPSFLYVAKVGEADRKKALADAFAQAQKDARRLAQAAGMDLGGLLRLVDQTAPGADLDELVAMTRRGYGRYGYGGGDVGAIMAGDEVIGVSPGKVVAKVGVIAHFKLVPAK
jgi:hypothetical protein